MEDVKQDNQILSIEYDMILILVDMDRIWIAYEEGEASSWKSTPLQNKSNYRNKIQYFKYYKGDIC